MRSAVVLLALAMADDLSQLSAEDLPVFLRKEIGEKVADVIKDAEISGKDFVSLSRDDLSDLLPGPQYFLLRLKLWKIIINYSQEPASTMTSASSCSLETFSPLQQSTSSCASSSPAVSVISPITSIDHISFPMYMDGEIARSIGIVGERLRNRLVRNTISMMRSRTHSLESPREPNCFELDEMAKKLIVTYPLLGDDPNLNPNKPWKGMSNQLKRRLSNVKPVYKPQGRTPQRSKRMLEMPSCPVPQKKSQTVEDDSINGIYPHDSSSDTICEVVTSDSGDSGSEGTTSAAGLDSDIQGRHLAKLQELAKQKRPNLKVVGQLLDLEFPQRRNFISSLKDTAPVKVKKILECYPMLQNVDQCLEEVRRLVDGKNRSFVEERLLVFDKYWNYFLFYGLHKKVHGPPEQLNEDTKCLTVMRNLQSLFTCSMSKRSKSCSLFRELKNEDIDKTVKSTKDPVMLLKGNEILIALHVCLLCKVEGNWSRGLFALMAAFYLFELPYPAGAGTALSIIQTELLLDSIHTKDQTKEYRVAEKMFKAFLDN